MRSFFLALGTIGSIMLLSGSLPQIAHLLKVKDSTGQSIFAWLIWIVANMLTLTYAIYIKDPIFIFLDFFWVILCSLTLFLILVYRKKNNESIN